MMNKRQKQMLKMKIENAAAALSCVMLVWGLASWVDVLNHNMSDYNYAWWNLIVIFSKVAAAAVGVS